MNNDGQSQFLCEFKLLFKKNYLLFAVIALIMIIKPYFAYRPDFRAVQRCLANFFKIVRRSGIRIFGVNSCGCVNVIVFFVFSILNLDVTSFPAEVVTLPLLNFRQESSVSFRTKEL